jgi:hypothetical protein
VPIPVVGNLSSRQKIKAVEIGAATMKCTFSPHVHNLWAQQRSRGIASSYSDVQINPQTNNLEILMIFGTKLIDFSPD